jgi:hypothetical protein
MGAIAGGIVEAYYGPIPAPIARQVTAMLPLEFSAVIDPFCARFDIPTADGD